MAANISDSTAAELQTPEAPRPAPPLLQPYASAVVLTVAGVTLASWIADLDGVLVGSPPLDPRAATALLVAAVAALRPYSTRFNLRTILGVIVVALGFEQLITVIRGAPFLLPAQWPAPSQLQDQLGTLGFTSPACIVGIGVALCLSTSTRRVVVDISGAIVIAIMSLSMTRLFDAALAAAHLPVISRQLNPRLPVVAASLFLLLGIAMLETSPNSSLHRARRALPPAAIRVTRNVLVLVGVSIVALVVLDIDAPHRRAWWWQAVLFIAWLTWGAVAVVTGRQVLHLEQERSLAVDALSASEQRFRRLADHAPDVILRFAIGPTHITYANSRIEHLTGYPPEAFMADGTLWKKLIVSEDQTRLPDWRKELADAPVIVRVRHRTGMVHWVEARVSPIRDDAGAVIAADAIVRDITDSKRAEANLARRAYLDPVTNLANRNAVEEQLGYLVEAFRHPSRTDLDGQFAVVFFLDLDGFKAINDRLGHDAGDHILMLVGERLRSSVKDDDMVARFGGDEFIVVVDAVRTREQGENIANRILMSLRSPFVVGDRQMHVTTSIGVSRIDRIAPKDPGTHLREADKALYLAKESGKDRVRWFDDVLDEQSTARHPSEITYPPAAPIIADVSHPELDEIPHDEDTPDATTPIEDTPVEPPPVEDLPTGSAMDAHPIENPPRAGRIDIHNASNDANGSTNSGD